MTIRATTRDQFRLVLRWVKDHPVLAKSDNETPKGLRDMKKDLWEKLTIELNEIGPPVKTYMGWKRVLTDYKYSLRKKIQRRIQNTDQDGSQILASLNELENEALQVSLLDLDFSDPDKISCPDTPPEDMSMHQSTDDPSAPQEINTNGHEDSDRNNFDLAAQNDNGHLENLTKIDSSGLSQFAAIAVASAASNGMPNANATITSGSLEAIMYHQNIPSCSQPTENAEDLSKTSSTVSTGFYCGEVIKTELDEACEVAQNSEGHPASEARQHQFPDIPDNPEISGMQNESIPNIPTQMDQYPDMSHVPMPAYIEQQGASLTTEEMNMIIAREIDRMKKEGSDKPRKISQRKKPERPRKLPEENQHQQSAEKPKKIAQENRIERPKKVSQKPKPKVVKVPKVSKILKDTKGMKKFMSSREFRHRLLTLLTEANEMEKRRIAITETKVRNQTEIQSLEITRMNLEIMKLQKEILLLDHGGKIFT